MTLALYYRELDTAFKDGTKASTMFLQAYALGSFSSQATWEQAGHRLPGAELADILLADSTKE